MSASSSAPTSLNGSSASPGADAGAGEAARLEALARYDILDTPPEERFDRFTRLAARLLGAPMAQLSFIDAERLWSKSAYGLSPVECPCEEAWYALLSDGVTVVEDATQDERFAESASVTGPPRLRFYAGAPLITPDGHRLGALSVFDTQPRRLPGEDRRLLADLAATVVDALELRRSLGKAEQARWKAQEKSHFADAIIDGMPGIFYLFDLDGQILRWNDHFETLTGYGPNEIAQMGPLDFIAPGAREEAIQHLTRLVDTGHAGAEVPFQTKDGRRVSILCTGRRVVVDGQVRLAGTGVDVSERRNAEQSLRASERQYRQLFARANVPVIIFRPEGERILEANPAACRLYGFSHEELLGRSLQELTDDVERGRREVRQILAHGGTRNFETRHFARNGTPLNLLMSCSLIEYADAPAILLFGRNITERKTYERELVEAKEEAEEMARLKSAFLANMSHEVRTPLATIAGFAEVIFEETEQAHHREFAGIIERASTRLEATLTSVLDLARLEADDLDLDLAPLDVTAQMADDLDLFASQARKKGLAFDLELPDAPVYALADEVPLSRVLANLLSNAIKFTDEGRVRVCAGARGGKVCIEVEDTGTGISEEFLPQLFDDFKQESAGIRRSHEGSGLGLSITQRLVELMDGRIEVESQKGRGTTFTVALPLVRPGAAPSGGGEDPDAVLPLEDAASRA